MNRIDFQHAAEACRRELQVHCYRILGSLHESEDAIQETMLRAWRSIDSFAGRASLRSWLYRIATNVCLNMIKKRSVRRSLPQMHGEPAYVLPELSDGSDIRWLEPYPDAQLESVIDKEPGPSARYEQREAMHLAFIAALQYLPGRQRAALLLHDVLGCSGSETADMLGVSEAAVNSALQRARATLKKHPRPDSSSARELANVRHRALFDHYVRAWESKDLDGLVALMKEDAIMSMPPTSQWYQGRDVIRAIFAWAWKELPYTYRLFETSANGQPAFAMYARSSGEPVFRAHALHVLSLDGQKIANLTTFLSPDLFSPFGLAPTVDARKEDYA